MSTKTITFDENEFKYPDIGGIIHIVTAAQTITFELTDGGASDVTYAINNSQEVTTTDGLLINFRPSHVTAEANTTRLIGGTQADANDAIVVYSIGGELDIEDPTSGVVQHWKPSIWVVNNVDAPTFITAKFEDQYSNSFTWTNVTIA